jgi:hypothetical protein
MVLVEVIDRVFILVSSGWRSARRVACGRPVRVEFDNRIGCEETIAQRTVLGPVAGA